MDVHHCLLFTTVIVFFAGSSVKRLMVLHHGLQMPLYFTYSCLTVAVDKFEKFTETLPKACGSATATSMEECRTVASVVGCGGHYGWCPMVASIQCQSQAARLRRSPRIFAPQLQLWAASELSDLGAPPATLGRLGALRSSRPAGNFASANSEADHAHKQTPVQNTDGTRKWSDVQMPVDPPNVVRVVDISWVGC